MSDKSPKVIPPFAAQPANSGGRIGDTDWMCPDVVCGNVNFARRNSCNRCGKERVDLKSKKKLGTEIGKSAADKSRGLFSADDWQCNKCANVNWARRQTCNVCNAPKFGEQVEARTGYGGGYNERGTVEYRPKRDSDDDEYDEFGRRKKRKLKDCSSTQDKVVPATSRPRTLIMENRVSSTNELKYRFSGKIRDENFEVTYTLQERISAAAWALAYQSCRVSSEKFENTFDKPAPDFKTIFAWRQRLLYNGCLVDKHFYVEDNSPKQMFQTNESLNKNKNDHNTAIIVPGRFNRRKRMRYFNNIPPRDTTDSSTSENEDDLPRKSTRRSLPLFKKVIVLAEDKQKVKPLPNEPVVLSETSPEESTERFLGSMKKKCKGVNCQNNSKNLEDNNYEYFTEDNNIRSVTPELTVVRSDLANFVKSPVRVEIPESQFSEDIYFHDDLPLAARSNEVGNKHTAQEVEQFLMPKIPTEKKLPQKPIDSLLNVLEDIVSESERYSSDGNASETDSYEKIYGKDETVKKPSPLALDIVPQEVPKYQPSHTVALSFSDSSLPKFCLQPCTKNMSVAMQRIYESMTSSGNDAERIDELVLEYIPTKINPAMAKRNHQFFNDDLADDVISECNARPLQISKMPSPIKATVSISPQKPDILDIMKKKVDSPKKPEFKLSMFEDYLPEEDDLYKDSSSDGGVSDRTMMKTPPAAPNIGPMVTETAQEPQKVQDHMTENMTTITKVMCQPAMLTESPENINMSPVFVTKPPVIVTQPTVFCANVPVVFNDPPPSAAVTKSTVVLNASPVAVTKSTATITKSPVVTKSTAASTKHGVSPPKPTFVETKSPVAVTNPPVVVTKSPVTVTKPTVALPKSRVSPNETIFALTKPPIVVNNSPVTVAKCTTAICNPLVILTEHSVPVIKPLDAYNKPTEVYTKSPDAHNKPTEVYTKSPDAYNKPTEVYTKSPDAYNKPTVINAPAIFAIPPIDFSKPPPPIVQKEPTNLSSICNFNFANINANDLIRALQNIQNLSTASTEESVDVDNTQNDIVEGEDKNTEDVQIVEERQQEVIDCDVEKVLKKPACIPFLGDMFDPGSPVHENTSPKDPEVIPDFNFQVPLDNLLNLPLTKPIMGSFKSFAFAPKPIMLNRLRKINEQKLDKSCKEPTQDDKKVTKSMKRSRPDEGDKPAEVLQAEEGRARPSETPEEEDEESGEEGDLSKYDLWGSEDEDGGEKGQSKSPTVAANNNPVEKADDSPKNKSKSPPSKNSADKRRRKSESRSPSPSSRSSSSSSSSSDSSSGRTPRNRYDDFNLNSEHSPPSPPGRKDRGQGDRADRSEGKNPRGAHRTSAPSGNLAARHSGGLVAHSTTSANNRSSSSHKVDSGRRHRAHRHRR